MESNSASASASSTAAEIAAPVRKYAARNQLGKQSQEAGARQDRATLERLRLDPLNPRLPDPDERLSQEELIRIIDETYDPITIARSIAEHKYFESEPLIVIPDHAKYVVVEGNRRLVALMGLADEGTRSLLQDREEWDELAARATLPPDFPVIVAANRVEVAPIIGFRHISGIEPWDAFAKARFVTSLVDDGLVGDEDDPFDEVADLVGETRTDVMAAYRNFKIMQQGSEWGKFTANAEQDFGVFTRAMSTYALRDYIEAPPPRHVAPGERPLPADKKTELGRLLTWLFGDKRDRGRVISDSRDLKRLGRVISSEDGLQALVESGDLETAEEAAGGPRNRLIRRLGTAKRALLSSTQDIETFSSDEEVLTLLEECQSALDELQRDAEA